MDSPKAHYALGFLRLSMGFLFLWAFLDKLFGLGFSTAADKSWLAGASPTAGFLKNATHGYFASSFQALSGSPVVDWLFMFGLFGLGVSLLLGIGLKIAAYTGSLLMILMWLALFPSSNNPILDDHIIYLFALISFLQLKAGHTLGLGKWWENTSLVKKYPFLQ